MKPGDTISHFEILEKIGGGGMGVVYSARDRLLDRRVALKFLPSHVNTDPAARERFVQEAKAASALDHANICNIYEIGETDDGELFIAMAHYDGQTLKHMLEGARIETEQACDIGRQLAKGLERAHDAGIIHRDVKPANIIVTDRGDVKLLDFGLAKLVTGANLTKTGSTLGTVSYMSPEQLRGEPADSSADVWSVGVVLFEMLTGGRPFGGEYEQAIMYAILNEDPPDLSASGIGRPVANLVMRCLSKDPRQRPTAREVADGLLSPIRHAAASEPSAEPVRRHQKRRPVIGSLARIGLGSLIVLAIATVAWFYATRGTPAERVGDDTTARQSIAVLPFTNIRQDDESVAFTAGIHDDILTKLAKIDELKVISRTSVMRYAGSTRPMGEIARELGVATVLEGGVQRAGDRVRMNVQLVDATTDRHLWAETYDAELSAENIFGIQSDIAEDIARTLKAELAPEVARQLERRPTHSLEAYDLFTRGSYLMNRENARAAIEGAADLFRAAIAADSGFAAAWAGLARAYNELLEWRYLTESEALPTVRSAAAKAVELDETLVSAHVALGTMYRIELQHDNAEREFRRALELGPGDPEAHAAYGELLRDMGRFDESIRSSRRAVELDPLSVDIRLRLVQALYFARQYPQVIEESDKLIVLEPAAAEAYYWRAFAFGLQREFDSAIAASTRAVELEPHNTYNHSGLAWMYALAGKRDEALSIIHGPLEESIPLVEAGLVYGTLGDLDRGFEYMNRALDETPSGLWYLRSDPAADPLRSDPRWAELMTRVKADSEL